MAHSDDEVISANEFISINESLTASQKENTRLQDEYELMFWQFQEVKRAKEVAEAGLDGFVKEAKEILAAKDREHEEVLFFVAQSRLNSS